MHDKDRLINASFSFVFVLYKTLTSKLLKPQLGKVYNLNISGAQQLLASPKLTEHKKLEIHNLHAKIQ